MDFADLTVTAERLWSGESFSEVPCLFVSACDSESFQVKPQLPPCPVILIGEAGEALSSAVDAHVADEDEARQLYRNILANPHAAQVTTDLLRMLPDLSLEQGLIAESLAYGVLQGSGEFAHWLAKRPAQAASGAGKVLSQRNGDTLSIILDRPEADNAIDRTMRDGMNELFELAALDRSIARIELRSTGRSFSLGADLGEFGTSTDPARAHAIRRQTLPARHAIACAERLHVHVQGACVGAGLELTAFARRVTAGPRAWFQLPELAMGLLPGAGGCVSLTRRIGRQKTALLYLSGKRLSAREALAWGIVDEITADESGADIG